MRATSALQAKAQLQVDNVAKLTGDYSQYGGIGIGLDLKGAFQVRFVTGGWCQTCSSSCKDLALPLDCS